MKYLPHIGLPLLMLALLGGAMVLPKFANKSTTESGDVEDVGDYTYEEMKQMLVDAGEEVPEVIVAPEPDSTEQPPTTPPVDTEVTDKPEFKTVDTPSTDEKMAPFFAAMETGNLDEAKKTLTSLSTELPASMIKGLEVTLSAAEAAQKQLDENRKKLAATNAELEASQTRFSAMEKTSLARIESTVKTLEAATKAAERAASEAADLRKEMKAAESASPAVAKQSPQPKKKVKLPDSASVMFGNDSSVLNAKSKATILSAVSELKKEASINLQLRGYADKTGDADYNAILSRARAEVVRDEFVKSGIEAERIEVISFGESTADAGASSESLRRVDLLFRSN